ncbi:hypothetical protein F5148DRAFT_382167 [Russula earlei]|uniref:Uncharacterized protein n=1 Tax=Russula earlei TaxID=71964 RepID=A0ACC0U1J9_9AGAM|nr:hypothetical protein F5148DRAFT_382167 [Russula earlei]
MGTICLSPAPGLRCVGLSLTEEVITLAPVGLEVIFSLGLVFVGQDAGRTRFILAAEGPTYLLLTILSLLGRVVPVFQNSLRDHKILDISVGAASFVPIFLYTFYLYLLKRKDFFPHLPQRFTLVANTFALVVIPVIIVTNEIGSFLGITYRKVPDPVNRIVGNQVAVGPDYASFQFGREFLRSTSLALLFIYQATTFVVFLVQLASCIIVQRDIEERAAEEREGVLFRGLGWLVVGMKMSAVESASGFASTSFGVVLTRRVLRMIGRACIIIGVVKGPDLKEEFLILDNEFLTGTRKLKVSGTRVNISSPQFVQSSMTQRISRMTSLRPSLTTFASHRPVSQSMTEFHGAPFDSRHSSGIPLDRQTRTNAVAPKPRPASLELARPSTESRVSVVRLHNRAPTLVLNLSPLGLPSGEMLAEMTGNQPETVTPTIEYIPASSVTLSAPARRGSPYPWVVRAPQDSLSGSPERDAVRPTQRREPARPRPSRRQTVSALPNPIDVLRTSASAPRESYIWSSVVPAPTGIAVDTAEGSSVPARQTVEAHHGHTRNGGQDQGSNSTVGGISIDWIAPEGDGRSGRFKSLGAAPRRTTPKPTSASAVRSSVALERQESLADIRAQSRNLSRRGMPRKDSGVLSIDDLARVRRSSPGTQ